VASELADDSAPERRLRELREPDGVGAESRGADRDVALSAPPACTSRVSVVSSRSPRGGESRSIVSPNVTRSVTPTTLPAR